MDERLPDTIKPNDEQYDRLGAEFTDRLHRPDGPRLAKSLHAHFEQDLRDWLYDRIWKYFSGISKEKWSDNAAFTAEIKCRNAVSFLQSVRGVVSATERGYIPTGDAEWYTNWLLRLNLGEAAAKEAIKHWLLAFKDRDRKTQLQLFTTAMSKCLPEIRGQFFLLTVYAPTLDLRVQATTVRAFGDGSQAQTLHAEAVSLDDKLTAAIRQYLTGGAAYYVLESNQGLLTTRSQEYGSLLHLWTTPDYAREINEGKYDGVHRIAAMNYRELGGQLLEMQIAGQRYVTLDRRMSGDVRVVPIGDLIQHVQKTINAIESSEIGQAMKDGFRD